LPTLRKIRVAFLPIDDVYQAYTDASAEALQWRKDYPQFERLMDNGLLDDLDENLPEVNDGSLAASLFKLSKRVIRKKMAGRAVAIDSDDQWITELANIEWEKKILKNANSQASPRRKWKDAVRKAAGYGGQPIITLFVDRGTYSGADFIVPYCQDVKLEAGKVSDEDSDIIFWDVYYTKQQVVNMLEKAKAEQKTNDGYNKWDTQALEDILNGQPQEDRPGNEESKEKMDKGVKKSGFHFYIAFQRGVQAPFYMCHKKKVVREWSNPDPTGDVPVHYLYCYQDFINPYGIGIVKLAGGTQNVLDYMRQSDVLATQLGFRPPKQIQGNAGEVDEESLVYAQDANWYVGNAKVERMEISNQVYQQLPERINMYQSSLNKMIPMGDSTVSSGSGDPMQSKTPAGVKQAQASLSVDDEDFMENVDETYAMVAKSMINTHFANMQGTDLMKLDPEEQEILQKAGIEFPQDENGQPSMQLEVQWDQARATFDFEIDPEAEKTADDEKRLEGLLKVAEFRSQDPNFDAALQADGKKLDLGELYSEIISLTTDNDKIIKEISPEEQQAMQEQAQQQGDTQQPKLPSESLNYKDAPEDIKRQIEAQAGLQPSTMQSPVQDGIDQKDAELQIKAHQAAHGQNMAEAQHAQTVKSSDQQFEASQQENKTESKPKAKATTKKAPAKDSKQQPQDDSSANLQAVMEHYGVDQPTAQAMLEAERQGYQPQEILDALKRHTGVPA
jgi:hypothetical protein